MRNATFALPPDDPPLRRMARKLPRLRGLKSILHNRMTPPMKHIPLFALSIIAYPAFADETRQLDAHVHGVSQLNIAVEGTQISMELRAPGADIVGFEYAAESAEDLDAVETVLATLADPLGLFGFGEAAGCSVVQADAALEGGEGHDHDHDHEEKADGHDHAGHDHDHSEGDAHDHAEHDHAEHAGHSEFNANYLLECADPGAASEMTFAFFDAFPNALEVEVQIISDSGAASFEVMRAEPSLDLSGAF